MDIWGKVNAAQRMQDYIHQHLDENIALDDICKAANYSKWHSLRIFKEIFRKTPFEYIRAMRMTNAARDIRHDSDSIVDIAMNTGFGSHEGFTKAFHAYFGVNPSKYRDSIPMRYMYFEPTSILEYYLRLNSKEHIEMSENQRTVTVTIVEKPACKLILARGIKATHYFELCEEIGCDKSELLETIAQKLNGEPYEKQATNHIYPGKSVSNIGRVSYVDLPPNLTLPNTSRAAFALEVPADYNCEIPDEFDIVDLPPFSYMWFQGAPYEDENWFGCAHEELARAIKNYKPELYGFEFAKDAAPHFMYGTSAATGCREMIPIRNVE